MEVRRKMSGASPLKHGLVDLAAILFVIGGVVSLIMNLLTIPIQSVYPTFTLPSTLDTAFLVVLGISVICSLGAIHCFSLTTRRMLSEAGIRGIVFGALLLIFSLGIVGTSFRQSNTSSLLTAVSAIMILIAGGITFALRHTSVSASAIARQHAIVQQPYQS
jgi:hypothetical protein